MRFRYFHQRDSMQCGVACLAMACSALGRHITLATAEEFCQPTVQGVSLKGLADGAKELGLQALPAKVDFDYLQAGETPQVILHWNQNHFVLLRRISRSGRKVLIADPAKGVRWYSREEFLKHWLPDGGASQQKGIALLLSPTQEFYAQKGDTTGHPKLHKKEFLKKHMAVFKKKIAVVLLLLALAGLLQLIFPFLTQAIVDKGIGNRNISLIWLILLGEMMLIAGRTVTDFLRRRILLHVSVRVNIRMLTDFFAKLMKLPMRFFDTKLMGDLVQRISDHQRVQQFLTGQAINITFAVITFLIFSVVMLYYSPLIFGVFMAGSVIYGAWIALFLRRRRVLDYETFEAQAINQNRTYQLITTMTEIKLQGCGERRSREWTETQEELFDIKMRSLRLTQTQEGGSIFINEIKNILITVLSAMAVIRGELSLGGMMAIQYIAGQLSSPVQEFMSFAYSFQDMKLSLERIADVHEQKDEDCDKEEAVVPAAHQEIIIENLKFRYDRHNPSFVLNDVSLLIPPGKVTAIVGASGSGKTTLLKLLLGYYSPDEGSIRIGDVPITEMNHERWRERCGVVMQDGVIFSDSIERNIATHEGEVDVERMENAARMACLHDTVMAMPLKYATKVGKDGVGLSQGQKQRILIARAIYRNPEYLLLDEATNSLDASNERAIVEGLADFYRGRTVIVVAHRLSTVKDADNIVVLEGGRIVEQGSHEELVKRGGTYFRLIRNQLELGS